MTYQDVLDAVEPITENRASKLFTALPDGTLPALTFLNLDIGKIIHRQRYWWRRRIFTLTTAQNTAGYDLYAGNTPIASDFEQMINLYYLPSPGNSYPLTYMHDHDDVQNYLNAGTSGPPEQYLFKPPLSGVTTPPTTLMISPKPDSAYPLAGLYWATYIPIAGSAAQLTTPIPLIPLQFHYIAVLAFMKRIFLYLFGQADPRYESVRMELEGRDGKSGELRVLDEYRQPTVEDAEVRPIWMPQPWASQETVEPLPK